MVHVSANLSNEEYHEYLQAKGSKTLREIILDALGIVAKPRKIGRPHRAPLSLGYPLNSSLDRIRARQDSMSPRTPPEDLSDLYGKDWIDKKNKTEEG